jgi:hypothetical protein
VDGVLTNFSAIRQWHLPSSPDKKQPSSTNLHWQTTLRQVVSVAEKIHFSSPPDLTGRLSGDLSDPDSIHASLQVNAPGATTPWGQMTQLKLEARGAHILNPGTAPFAWLRLSANTIKTTWGGGERVGLRMELHRTEDMNLLDGKVNLNAVKVTVSGADLGTNWLNLGVFQWDGALTIGVTNFVVPKAEGQLHLQSLSSSWGSFQEANISFQSVTNEPTSALPPDLSQLAAVWNRKLDWQITATDIATPQIQLHSLEFVGQWNAPDFVIENLESHLYDGMVRSSASLNILSRRFNGNLYTDFELKSLSNVLTAPEKHWLDKVVYSKPPVLHFQVGITLPAHTNLEPDWAAEVLPTLQTSGNISIGPVTVEGISLLSAESTFAYSNQVFSITNLHINRTNGDVRLNCGGNLSTHEFHAGLDTQVDPKWIIQMMDDSQETKEILDSVQLAHFPKIHVDANGNWNSLETIQATGEFEATNFVALGEPIGKLTFSVGYANPVLSVTNIQLIQGDHIASIPLAQYNFSDDRVYLHNGHSTFNPRRVFLLLEPVLPEFLTAIWFEDPSPEIRAYGFFSLSDDRDVDMHFQVSGKKFRWSKYTADSASGNVDWIGPDVWLTNVVASLYGGGSLSGWATFDCRVRGTAIRFAADAQDADLKLLSKDISGRDMELEGKLSVSVDVHGRANSRKSWEGVGEVSLRDGLLWDIPMFGKVISPLLNGIAKGAANNRAREASGPFIVTNGIVKADRIEIQASWVRLVYSGTADENTIDAVVEAQVLRNTPVIGQAISFILTPLSKVFKYRVTGPTGDPEIKPEYVPGMVLDKTLHPLKTLKDTFIPGGSGSQSGNPGSK